MQPDVALLFDDWAARSARGERPDPREYLDRAGERRAELSRLMDAYLRDAPRREPTDADLALVRAASRHEPPLLELRRRRGLKRSDVVDALQGRLELDPAKRHRLARAYHELESGLLDVRGVSRRVFDVLRELFDADVRDLAAWRAQPAPADVAFYRADLAPPASIAPASLEPAEPDEIDLLFRSTPGSDDNSGRGWTGH